MLATILAANRSGSLRAGPGNAITSAVCALSRESSREDISPGHSGDGNGSGVAAEGDPNSPATMRAASAGSTSPTTPATSVPFRTRERYQSLTLRTDTSRSEASVPSDDMAYG